MSIQSLFHISDIHIRAGTSSASREDEYLSTFEHLFALLRSFQQIQDNAAIIVVTGDIFHHKHILGPSGIDLAVHLFKGLAQIATTVVIRGNHDYRQDMPDEKDLISAIIKYNIPDLHYMNETGCLEIDNVGFGLIAIQDTLLGGATAGSVADPPSLPDPSGFSEDVTHRVALFHGEVTKASLQSGYVRQSKHTYPLKKFEGYDLVLLGDIHQQQVKVADPVAYVGEACEDAEATALAVYKTRKGSWGYPSSLIQQNYGEGMLGHGLLHWNLADGTVTEYHVHNDYGFVPLTVDAEGAIRIQVRKEGGIVAEHLLATWVGEEVMEEPWFPRKVRVSVTGIGVRCTDATLERVKGVLEAHGREVVAIHPSYSTAASHIQGVRRAGEGGEGGEGEEDGEGEGDGDIASLNSPDMWTQYILEQCEDKVVRENEGLWRDWFKTPNLVLVPTVGVPAKLTGTVTTVNEKPFKAVQVFQRELDAFQQEARQTATVSLRYMEWSWLFNFGPNNHYNFQEMDGRMAVLNAKNGHGKSNFFETICVALFGQGFPSREIMGYMAAFLSNRLEKGAGIRDARTFVVFAYQGVEYSIERVFEHRTDGRSVSYKTVVLRREGVIEFQGVNAVRTWVHEHIGTVDTFLTTSMLTQDGDCNFFGKSAAEQKDLIDHVFSLKVIDELKNFLDVASKAHGTVAGHLQSYLSGAGAEEGQGTLEDAEGEVVRRKGLLDETRLQLVEAAGKWSRYSRDTFTRRGYASYSEELEALEKEVGVDGGNDVGGLEALKEERMRLRMRLEGLVTRIGGRARGGVVSKPAGEKRSAEQAVGRLRGDWEREKGRGGLAGLAGSDKYTTAAECRAALDEYKIWQEGWRRQGSLDVEEVVDGALEEAEARLGSLLDARPLPPTRVVRGCVETLQVMSLSFDDRHREVVALDQALVDYDAIAERWMRVTRKGGGVGGGSGGSGSGGGGSGGGGEDGFFNPDCKACVGRKESLLQERKTVQALIATMTDRYGGRAELVASGDEARKRFAVCVAAREDLAVIRARDAYEVWTRQHKEARITVDHLTAIKREEKAKRGLRERYEQERVTWEEDVGAAVAGLDRCLKEAEALWTQWVAWDVAQAWAEHDAVTGHLRDVEGRVAEAERCVRLVVLRGIVAAYPHFVLEQDLMGRKADLEAAVRRAEERLATVRRGYEVVGVREALKKIELRRDLLECLAHAIRGYTKWLYTERLAPLIQGAVSGLLEGVCEERPLVLEAEWEDKARSFVWFLRDGTNRTVLQKASGFQRFIVGMAMRIAMSRLGICRAEYKQFFIDEGFTACDGENLEKAPAFLRSLLEGGSGLASGTSTFVKGYSSVVLATHLEELKTCGDVQVGIARDALSGVARVAVGTVRAAPSVPADKAKRGRPKKAPAGEAKSEAKSEACV